MSKAYVEKSIYKAAKENGVPHKLLRAICMTESNLKPKALNHSDGGFGNHAIGLCQLLYTTAAAQGLHDQRCLKDWRKAKKSRIYRNCKLWGPYTNASTAAKYLKFQLKRYKGDQKKAVAAYNAGSVKRCNKRGYYYNAQRTVKFTCKKGGFLNSHYVTKVFKAIDRSNKKWAEIEALVKE
jgi:soluble lytic murein transglycosylase-like protein